MRRTILHPTYERLSEFSDGTLSSDRLRRITGHLERCGRCRREVGLMRDADAALRAVPVPTLPQRLFERVIERRNANIRTILPADPVPRVERATVPGLARLSGFPISRIWMPVGGATVIALLASTMMLFAPRRDATAGASVFKFAGNGRVDGRVAALYEPGSLLKNEAVVYARARVWSLDPAVPPVTVDIGVLRRGETGFEGLLDMPRQAGYMLVALEDADGVTIDANAGEFWDRGSDVDGSGSAAAHLAQLRAYQELSQSGLLLPSRVRLLAVRATESHPDSPALWAARATYELQSLTPADSRDALLAQHRERLGQFVSLSEGGVHELEPLLEYASAIGDSRMAEMLLNRLASVAPRHRLVIEKRVEDRLSALAADDAAGFLGTLEKDYIEAEAFSSFISNLGYAISRDLEDPETHLRWALRLYEGDAASRDGIAIELASFTALRPDAIALLGDRLDFYAGAPDSLRALHQSTRDYSSGLKRRSARLWAALGTALADEGDVEAALGALETSIRHQWDPVVAARLAKLAAQESLVTRARELAVLVSVDPLYNDEFPTIGEAFSEHELARAAIDLDELLHRDSRGGRIPDAVLRSRIGARVPVDDGGITVIALWQAPPALQSEESSRIANAARRLSAEGIRVLIASPEQWLDATIAVADMVGARPVVDERGSATEGFGGWDLWEYVVVHDGLYSVHYNLDDATRVALLTSEISSNMR